MRRSAPPRDREASTDVGGAREAALRLLERTRRTRADLERRLRAKGFAEGTVGEALERLAGVGLVDDVEFARAWLAGRWGRRPAGWRRLEQELRVRGISGDDITAARARLEDEQGVGDELAAARKVVVLTERRMAALEPRVRRRRLYALLARRGFDGDTIERALSGRGSEEDADEA